MRVLVRDLKCNLCRCVIQFILRCSPRSTVERAGFLPGLADHQNAPWFIIFSCCVKRLVFVTVRLTLTLKHCNFLASSFAGYARFSEVILPLFDSGIPSLDGFTYISLYLTHTRMLQFFRRTGFTSLQPALTPMVSHEGLKTGSPTYGD